jgi:putative DNA primase/helicase
LTKQLDIGQIDLGPPVPQSNGAGVSNLQVLDHDLPTTAKSVVSLLAASGQVFQRGGPVMVMPGDQAPTLAPLNAHRTILMAHELARPTAQNPDGGLKMVTLPKHAADLALAVPDWGLKPLRGITTAPLLSEDGAIRASEGYDVASALWCAAKVTGLTVPENVTEGQAQAALMVLRDSFKTFPFADAGMVQDPAGWQVVDLNKAPGQDESTFLAALLTAICRPSLPLAPGVLVTAPSISGAGTGKGLLVRAICAIAYSAAPRAFTVGSEGPELEKRLGAALLQAEPVLFLDNANGLYLRNDTLAMALSEPHVMIRPLGASRTVAINSTAFVAATGNGLAVSEDLARRFILVELDPRCEDPEGRPFAPGFLDGIKARRSELLSAALTIWRWGRQNAVCLVRGRPLGSYEVWAMWCRDPLMALGCADPVERIRAMKANDPARRRVLEFFAAWWECHGPSPVKASRVGESVLAALDLQGQSRQLVATRLGQLAGTRAGGFLFTRQAAAGKWSADAFVLQRTDAAERVGGADDPGTVISLPRGAPGRQEARSAESG